MQLIGKKNTLKLSEYLTLGGITIVLLLAERVGWNSSLSRKIQPVIIPFASGISSFLQYIEQPLYNLNHMYASASELSTVKKKYAVSLAALTELEQLKEENEQLRKMIENRHLSLNQRVVAAPVVSYAYPAVAVGSADLIKEGNLIVASDTLLGRVVEVSVAESRIELLSSKDAQPVLVETESGLQGLIQGTGRGVVLTHLPPDVIVEPGERVSTVGQPGIKQGIFVGVVSADQLEITSPVKTVPIDQLVSFYTTPLVEIW